MRDASRRDRRDRGSRRSRLVARRADRRARSFAPADLAAEPLRPRAARHHGLPSSRPARESRERHDLLARHRRPGPRHAVGDPLRPAHQPRRRRRVHARARSRSASAVGLAAAYSGGWIDALIMRIVDLQLSFPAILIALILLAVLGPGRGQDHHRAGHRAVGLLRAHGARRRRWSSARRNTWRRRACLALSRAAHRVPPHPAELPAAADRRRDRAGRARDRARGDAVVPRPRPADHLSRRSAC